MKASEKLVLVKNAVANVARGTSAALVAIALPPFLTRMMSADAYGAWALILQVSAYMGYLDFGIQTAVGRFVAYATERGETELRNAIVSTAVVALIAAGTIGLAVIVVASAFLPHLFPQMSPMLVGDARLALVIVGGSLAVGLPASVANGVFAGLERFEIPAVTVGGSRILSAVVLVLVVRQGMSLTGMAVAVASVNLVSYLIQLIACRVFAPWVHVSPAAVSFSAAHELFDYCKSLTVWSFAMLLVTGLDTVVVGAFDFHAVAYYAVAATLITFIVGLQNAIFSVLIPKAAALGARESARELGAVLLSTTRIGMLLLLASGLPLLIAPEPILGMWVGPAYAVKTFVILRVLVIANVIRLSAVPYAMLLIGSGQQKLVIVSPLLEGGSNLVASIIAGALMGAVGVAIGTLIGSVVGVVSNFVYNMPRTKGIAIQTSTYILDGLFRPALCFLPMIFLLLLTLAFPANRGTLQSQLIMPAAILSLVSLWIFGLSVDQRSWVVSRLRLASQ